MHEINPEALDAATLCEWVRLANKWADRLILLCARTGQKHTDYLRERFSESNLVIGVWNDEHAQYGCGFGVLKGLGRLMLISQAKKSSREKFYVVRARCYEDAAAMCLVYGDDRIISGNLGSIPFRRRNSAMRPERRRHKLNIC